MSFALFEWDFDCQEVLDFTHPSTLTRINREVHKAMENEMALAVARAQASTEFKDQTGAFRAGITFEVEGSVQGNDLVFRLFSPVSYGGFLEDGTQAHDIRPVTARVLRWTSTGNTYFARKVHHPGTRARRILASAVNFVDLEIAVGKAVVRGMRTR